MRIRIYRRGSKPADVPWWVWAGICDRYGFPLSRSAAIWNAWLATIVPPVALVVGLSTAAPQRYLILCFALSVIPFAVFRWLAIRWLDKRKAWKRTRRRDIRVR